MVNSNIKKSENDKREGYTYVLPNKLRVFIINDKDAETACVAMLVKIGYFQDSVSGMAHFLEHMLFNGTTKYPDENAFSSYISKHNGYQNAYTTHDHTCYFFTVSQDGLNEGLEMFGEFFISPLLNKDCVDREKEAVNSEHIKNINDDGWRRQELLRAASNEEHWFKNFGTGSNKTLAIENIDIKVREFFEKYYSSHLMTLVVLTNDKIENKKNIIDRIFTRINIRDIDEKFLILNKPILETPKVIKYLPIEEDHRMILTWELPFFKKTPYESPIEFFCILVGNEQKDSINDILLKKGYIISIAAYIREVIMDKCLFSIEIKMTPLGEKKKHEIIGIIYDFFELLKKNVESDDLKELYDEQLKLNKYKFDHFEKSNCSDTVLELCTIINMFDIEMTDVFVKEIKQEKYTQKVKNNLNKILSELTPEKMITMIGSKKYSGEKYKDRIKKYNHYGTEYIIKNKSFVYKIMNGKINLPKKNEFISLSNKIYNIKNSDPVLIKDDKITTYWMQNIKYNVPDIFILIKINIEIALENVYTDTCLKLYLMSLETEICDLIYKWRSALYDYSLLYNDGCIYLKINGNHEKINDVLSVFIENLKKIDLITTNSFESSKLNLIKNDRNSIFLPPYLKIMSNFKKSINKAYYNSNDRLKIIDKIEREDVIKVFNKIIENNNILLFVAGNCNEKHIIEINKIVKNMGTNKYDYSEFNKKYYREIKKTEIHEITNDNEIEENYCNGYYIYIDNYKFKEFKKWGKQYCILKILDNMISTEYFDELRTKESFGYITSGKIVSVGDPGEDICYYLFLVQSPNKTPKEITLRTQKFINEFTKKIKDIDEKEIEIMKNSYITSMMEEFNNLSELSYYMFDIIENGCNNFDYREKMCEYCREIKKSDLEKFYEEKFLNGKNLILQLNKKN
jgi:insulysin